MCWILDFQANISEYFGAQLVLLFSWFSKFEFSWSPTFQKEHCQIGSFLKENFRNDSVWKIFLMMRDGGKKLTDLYVGLKILM